MYYLIADIGGTNARFEAIEIKNKKTKSIFKQNILSSKIEDFTDTINHILNLIINTNKILIENAVFAVAGPIKEDKTKLTNLDLTFDLKKIKQKTSLKNIEIINDFLAQVYATNKLTSKSLIEINKGKIIKNKNKVIIGAGTGLGCAYLNYNNKNICSAITSEAGHQDIAIENKEEFKLIEFIKKITKNNQVVYEDLISGRGLEFIHEFLTKKKLCAEEISNLKLKEKKETFALFYKFYARFAKNQCIAVLSESGIYLSGGIIKKNIPSKKQIMDEFLKHNCMTNYLKNIPIYIITKKDTGLMGIKQYILGGQ